MNIQMSYDLSWKAVAMEYFLDEMKKRRDWRLYPLSKVKPPPQEGVVIDNGSFHIDGSAMYRWDREAIFFAEAYISLVTSFFDILGKAFSSTWRDGQKLYFKDWIADVFKANQSEPFLKDLHDFNDKWVKPISEEILKYQKNRSYSQDLERVLETYY